MPLRRLDNITSGPKTTGWIINSNNVHVTSPSVIRLATDDEHGFIGSIEETTYFENYACFKTKFDKWTARRSVECIHQRSANLNQSIEDSLKHLVPLESYSNEMWWNRLFSSIKGLQFKLADLVSHHMVLKPVKISMESSMSNSSELNPRVNIFPKLQQELDECSLIIGRYHFVFAIESESIEGPSILYRHDSSNYFSLSNPNRNVAMAFANDLREGLLDKVDNALKNREPDDTEFSGADFVFTDIIKAIETVENISVHT